MMQITRATPCLKRKEALKLAPLCLWKYYFWELSFYSCQDSRVLNLIPWQHLPFRKKPLNFSHTYQDPEATVSPFVFLFWVFS